MKELLKDKRVIALIVAVLVTLLSALGWLSDDVKEAIHNATAPKIEAPAVIQPPAPSPVEAK